MPLEMTAMECGGCGSTNVVFDPRQRLLICHTCGRREYYSRATLNANGKVVFARRNAINFFKQAHYEDARHFAQDVLNISSDNAPAYFIIACCDSISRGSREAMRRFFADMGPVALEYEEVTDLMELVIAAASYLVDYEEDIIRLIASNFQSPEDSERLCRFFDTFCPYCISKRSSCLYLTPALAELYTELVQHCGIPKTCFALLKSIRTNPDSPFADGGFFMKNRSQYFYSSYILPIGKVLQQLPDPALRAKFLSAFESTRAQFTDKTGVDSTGA